MSRIELPLTWTKRENIRIVGFALLENELLVWIIRTATASGLVREQAADHSRGQLGQPSADPRSAPAYEPNGRLGDPLPRTDLVPVEKIGPQLSRCAARAGQESGPVPGPAGHAHHEADQVHRGSGMAGDANLQDEINAAAVAAYQASVESGKPLSERKLAGMFDRTSRRWARHRMAEARQVLAMT